MKKNYLIVGGMGPLTSARFISTVYAEAGTLVEQKMPSLVLSSLTFIPDRTAAIVNNKTEEVTIALKNVFKSFQKFSYSKSVVLCFTAHAFFKKIPVHFLEKNINLVDYSLNLINPKQEFLLLSTLGVRESKIFQRSPAWSDVCKNIILPNDYEAKEIHKIIYLLKKNKDPDLQKKNLSKVLRRYKKVPWLLGCTDLHLIAASRKTDLDLGITLVDPLSQLAKDLAKGLL